MTSAFGGIFFCRRSFLILHVGADFLPGWVSGVKRKEKVEPGWEGVGLDLDPPRVSSKC